MIRKVPPMTDYLKNPRKLAVLLGVVIGLWVISGQIFPSENSPESASNVTKTGPSNVAVKVTPMKAKRTTRFIVLNGVTEPERLTLVEAQTEGEIQKILVEEGQEVAADMPLIQLNKRDRAERLKEAEALVKQRELEYDAANKLQKQGYQSNVRLAQAEAELATARRLQKQAAMDLEFATILAPYDGRVERIMVEEGDLAGRGMAKQTVLEFVDLDPLIVRGEIAERESGRIRKGIQADIRLVNGEEVKGIVQFVSKVADEETRTFRTEIAIPNPDRTINAGMSAEISLPAEQMLAYQVSASVLGLDDEGNVGVKLVDGQGLVSFHKVDIISQTEQGIMITGLPESIQLVTVGSNFVSAGQKVDLEKAMEKAVSNKADEAS
jgi:multidrug efflux system membrane fusion protein